MYLNLKDNKIFGYDLNVTKSKKNIDKPFVNKETNELIDYNVDNDCFLKPLLEYNNPKYILKIFGGSTSFCTEVNQEDAFFEKSLFKISALKNIHYKNYSIPGHDLLHDYHKLKNFAVTSYENSESIFIFNNGWNEEFIISAYPLSIKNQRPLNCIETNFIYQKNILLSNLCKNYYFAKIIKKFTNKRFAKLMNFYGTERWSNFINNNYINYWLKNLEKILKLIINKKAIIINNPGLAHLSDNSNTINYIIENSRLNKKYHLYQSLCLEINTIVNNNIATFFNLPIIDINSEFKKIDVNKRLDYFIDEIHLSRKGHEFASKIVEENIINLDLEKIKKIQKKDFNTLKSKTLRDIQFILNIANREIYKNYSLSEKIYSIPIDRYPSYKFK
jgi:hypothetical protein|tara:strand:+ start:2154 stop:3320 length:1167 start_codon:yes stop_codon:yes gene_type:complete